MNASAERSSQHRERLRRMVQLRMDRRLLGRLDPSDVLQEACLEFSRSLAQYLRKPDSPIYWHNIGVVSFRRWRSIPNAMRNWPKCGRGQVGLF